MHFRVLKNQINFRRTAAEPNQKLKRNKSKQNRKMRACSGSVSLCLLFAFAQVKKNTLGCSFAMFRVGFHSTPRIDLAGGIEGGVVALFKLHQKIKKEV